MNTFWESLKRIAHALVWLWIFAIVVGLAAEPFWGVPNASSADILSFSIWMGLVLGGLLLWICAIRRRWSLKWPLMILLLAGMASGSTVPFVVSAIGLGKLMIQWVGRGSMVTSSSLRESVLEARPRGLVEYTSYD